MARFSRIVSTIDSHTAGEPTRLVVGGVPRLRGATMAERMAYARRELDGLRGLLTREPRGRQDMYGALLTSPTAPEADFGLIFMNTRQYTTMCGHAVMGVTTTVIETGMVEAIEPETVVLFDTPVGLVRAQARLSSGRVESVTIQTTPVFVQQRGVTLPHAELGELVVDLVYSGGFFVLVDGKQIDLVLSSRNAAALADLGAQLRQVANDQLAPRHPGLPFETTIGAVEFHGVAELRSDGSVFARNATTFGERTLDRSPCGTGTAARMAVLHSSGALAVGQSFISEGILGTRFVGEIVKETQVGEFKAIVPKVTGRAYLTGFHQFVLDPDDPFPEGFSLGDRSIQGGSRL